MLQNLSKRLCWAHRYRSSIWSTRSCKAAKLLSPETPGSLQLGCRRGGVWGRRSEGPGDEGRRSSGGVWDCRTDGSGDEGRRSSSGESGLPGAHTPRLLVGRARVRALKRFASAPQPEHSTWEACAAPGAPLAAPGAPTERDWGPDDASAPGSRIAAPASPTERGRDPVAASPPGAGFAAPGSPTEREWDPASGSGGEAGGFGGGGDGCSAACALPRAAAFCAAVLRAIVRRRPRRMGWKAKG